MRSDITVSEDDNVLVNGVAGDVGAIGYFGSAYYFENQDRLRSVPIINPDTGEGVRPTPETIESGEYAPFSRPLFIYVRADALQQPHVQQFVSFYLDNAAEMAAEVGYVGLPADIYRAAERKIDNRETGTVYVENGEAVSGSLRDLYMEASTGRGLPGLPE
jgi:phosphate transport system substrate-binding protein